MTYQGEHRPERGPDDVDLVFLRLATLPPPRDFGASVMRAVAGARPARASLAWLSVGIAALGTTLALAFLAGQALVGGGMFTLASGLLENEMVDLAPFDTFLALLDVVPWFELAGVAVALSVLRLALSRVASTPLLAPAPAGQAAT
jgi:hypothetical protein